MVELGKSKENFRLLDLSSDEESEDLQFEILSRKRKITRRERNRGASSMRHSVKTANELQLIIDWAVRGVMVLWLIGLTWLCLTLYNQMGFIQIDVGKVTTSSAGIDDRIQFCHTSTKELENKTNILNERLKKLEEMQTELAAKVDSTATELAKVTEQLSAAPILADMPKRFADLQRMVADFGSQIKGLDGSVVLAKKQAVAAATGVEELKTSLSQLEAKTNETIDNVTANSNKEKQLEDQIKAVIVSLTADVDALKVKVDEAAKTTTLAPSSTTSQLTSAPTQSTSTTTSTNLNTTLLTTTQAGQPSKPAILQAPTNK